MSSDILERSRRFLRVLEALGFQDVQKFARDAGLGHTTIRHQIKTGRFSGEVLSEILKRGGSANWLLTGEGPMLRGEVPELESVEHWQRQAEHWKSHALKMEGERDAYERAYQGVLQTLAAVKIGRRIEEDAPPVLNEPPPESPNTRKE